MRRFLLSIIFMAASSSVQATAENEKPRKPPKEAIEACVDRQENDNVQFSGRRGETIDAKCLTKHGTLVAVPTSHTKKPKTQQESEQK